MTSFDNVLQDIDQAISEKSVELQALQTAREALAAVNGSAPASSGGTPGPGRPAESTATRGRTRGRTGTRDDQAFRLIQENPGITIPALAGMMKIKPNYLYRVVPKMQQEGRVKKEGQGWLASVA